MTIQINPNTNRFKVYHEYFVLNNTNMSDIAQKLGITINNVSSTVSRLKKKLIAEESISTVTTSTTDGNSTTVLNQEISIQIIENDEGKIILSIKTCPEFENWMKTNKEVRDTTNLFGQGKTAKFYYLRVVDNYTDDINYPLINIRDVRFNFAVLRMVGISEGKTFELDGLMTEKMLETATKKLVEAFKQFYTKTVLAKKINISAEVVRQ